jgi:hypothetical protein
VDSLGWLAALFECPTGLKPGLAHTKPRQPWNAGPRCVAEAGLEVTHLH